MKQAVKETLIAFWDKLERDSSFDMIINQFEIFGYDFMIDDQMEVYLIEVNTNPCLDTSACPLM